MTGRSGVTLFLTFRRGRVSPAKPEPTVPSLAGLEPFGYIPPPQTGCGRGGLGGKTPSGCGMVPRFHEPTPDCESEPSSRSACRSLRRIKPHGSLRAHADCAPG